MWQTCHCLIQYLSFLFFSFFLSFFFLIKLNMSTRKSGYIFANTENLYPQTIIILFRTPSLSSCCTYTLDVGAIDIILLYFVRQKRYITITLSQVKNTSM